MKIESADISNTFGAYMLSDGKIMLGISSGCRFLKPNGIELQDKWARFDKDLVGGASGFLAMQPTFSYAPKAEGAHSFWISI